MVRTTLSCIVLFGSLIAVVAVLQRTSRQDVLHDRPTPSLKPAPAVETSRHAEEPRLAAVPEKVSRLSIPSQESTPLVRSSPDTAVRLVAFDEETDSAKSDKDTTEESFFDLPRQKVRGADDFRDSKPADEPADEPAPKEPARLHIDSSDLAPELSAELIELREKIRDCLGYYYQRPENVASRSPWGCMHWMIAYGVDAELIAGNRKVNAIGYLNYNGVCNGQSLFYTANGQIQANIGPGVQGHAGQYLAMLAQSRVKSDYPMLIDGQKFTVADLIEYEKLTCRPQTELTFKLIALTHYLKGDEKWRSNDGETWDIPRLIKEELAQPIIGAACGGTHRLTGFSYAVRKREQRKQPITGQYLRAKKFIDDYHEYTYKLQNPDGSFSTAWFAGREDNGGPGRRLETTGHITEWLAYSLPKDKLTDPRMVKAVDYLANLMIDNRNEKWGIGPLGHGLHALALYDERLFDGQPGKRAEQLAGRPRIMQRTPARGAESSQRTQPGMR
ncbi:MAG TPA: hypothetical protein VMP01_25490 [Pirellulaceae bacterium]|nr:hypothetical protein [Pirellulaceae bacterium]